MKRLVAFLIALYLTSNINAQNIQPAPLILQGKITNCPEKTLKVVFEDENDRMVFDTIRLNDAGEFYLKTFKIKKPQRTSIQQNRMQINNIFVAPGYQLTITGDGTDFLSLFKTKQITGIGAESNQYRVKMDSLYAFKKDSLSWYEMDLQTLLSFLKKQKALEDSVANVVFNRKPVQDKYLSFFKNMVHVDNESMSFYMMLQHILLNKYSYEKMTALVKENTPGRFLNGISNDQYLVSGDYKVWALPLYLNYIKQLDNLKDSTLAQQPGYELHKINEAFHGKVKEYYLYKTIDSRIARSSSIEKLNATKKSLETYFGSLKNEAYKKNITEAYSEKEQHLMLLQTGKPAPLFTLLSNTGQSYALSSFKGKVVYIDLWASWCGPCRAEMPNFRQLYDKYKGNDNIAFMGIAVFDGEKEWRKALGEEKPDWLQLYDKEGIVASSYVASAIPKYILIDKNGHVVNFNAPGPGNVEAIEKLINEEIAK
jgi:thiol-disulfide isomerase/thioredoxin